MRWSRQAVLLTLLGALLFGLALGMRRAVLETQYRLLGADFPFTLESALQYRRVKIIYDTGAIPALDKGVQFPEGIRTWRTYEVGAEYVQAALARVLPESLSVGDRLRWIESAWFCLGIPLLFLWIGWGTRSWTAATFAALFYAVSLSSVMRSTGQELSRENFALPFLVAHLALQARVRRPEAAWRTVWSIGSAWCLALALASWDMIQFYVMGWAAILAVQAGRGRLSPTELAHGLWCVGALACAGLAHPYHREHGFLASPGMMLAYGTVISAGLRWVWERKHGQGMVLPRLRRVILTALPWLVLAAGMAAAAATGLRSAYGHFGSLLWAKLRYLNHKPADPSLLSFDQSIMWTPSLHSATTQLTWTLFPAMLILSFIAAVFAVQRSRSRSDSESTQLVVFFFSSLLAFILFVRFHVFLALFSAALLGWWAAWAGAAGGWRRWPVYALLVCGIVGEAVNVLRDPSRWGRTEAYYPELVQMTRWLREHVAPDVVLANFGSSGAIAAYGKCPIVLHPKFESADIRQRVREYGELLFKGSEEELRDWADSLGVQYYVHGLGEFAERQPEYQMRYFVQALNPPEDAPARMLETQSAGLKYFRRLWSNRKYVVYRMQTRADEVMAAQQSQRALEALQRGDLAGAGAAATEALGRNPGDAKAREVYLHVESLREQGFGAGTHEQP